MTTENPMHPEYCISAAEQRSVEHLLAPLLRQRKEAVSLRPLKNVLQQDVMQDALDALHVLSKGQRDALTTQLRERALSLEAHLDQVKGVCEGDLNKTAAALVKEHLGLSLGDTLAWGSEREGTFRYMLEEIDASDNLDYSGAWQIRLSGQKVSASGAPCKGSHSVHFKSMVEARTHLGMSLPSARLPSAMSREELIREVEFCLEHGHPLFKLEGYQSFCSILVEFWLKDEYLDGCLGRLRDLTAHGAAARSSFRWDSAGRFFMGWALDEDATDARKVRLPEGVHLSDEAPDLPLPLLLEPKDFLRQLNETRLPNGRRSSVDFPTFLNCQMTPSQTRLHNVLVHLVLKQVAYLTQKMIAIQPGFKVQGSLMTLGLNQMDYARSNHLEPVVLTDREPRLYLLLNQGGQVGGSALEKLTGLSEEQLKRLTAYDWRDPGVEADRDWAQQLKKQGVTLEVDELARYRTVLVSRYHEWDSEISELKSRIRQMERDLQQARDKLAQQAFLVDVRQFLSTLNIGHKTGWSEQLAEKIKKHPSDVKRWLKQNLPDVYEELYPQGAVLARALKQVVEP